MIQNAAKKGSNPGFSGGYAAHSTWDGQRCANLEQARAAGIEAGRDRRRQHTKLWFTLPPGSA
jgi:hypothetical protein